jgi:hypothetical protein
MTEKVMHVADLSGEIVADPSQLIGVIVAHHPDLDEPKRIDVTPAQLEEIGKRAIAAVILHQEATGDGRPLSYALQLRQFTSLATHRPMEEVLADAQPVVPPKQPRRSHNATKDGEPLINYNEPENAGLPHKGKVRRAGSRLRTRQP